MVTLMLMMSPRRQRWNHRRSRRLRVRLTERRRSTRLDKQVQMRSLFLFVRILPEGIDQVCGSQREAWLGWPFYLPGSESRVRGALQES